MSTTYRNEATGKQYRAAGKGDRTVNKRNMSLQERAERCKRALELAAAGRTDYGKAASITLDYGTLGELLLLVSDIANYGEQATAHMQLGLLADEAGGALFSMS